MNVRKALTSEKRFLSPRRGSNQQPSDVGWSPFDPGLALRNLFPEDRAWRTFICHLKISPSSHISKVYVSLGFIQRSKRLARKWSNNVVRHLFHVVNCWELTSYVSICCQVTRKQKIVHYLVNFEKIFIGNLEFETLFLVHDIQCITWKIEDKTWYPWKIMLIRLSWGFKTIYNQDNGDKMVWSFEPLKVFLAFPTLATHPLFFITSCLDLFSRLMWKVSD